MWRGVRSDRRFWRSEECGSAEVSIARGARDRWGRPRGRKFLFSVRGYVRQVSEGSEGLFRRFFIEVLRVVTCLC